MKKSNNSYFYSGHYLKNSQTIRDSLEKISFDDSYIVSGDGDANDCPFDYAHIFLQGACNMFAYALHERFGYSIYKIESCSDKATHWFCETIFQGKVVYVDVRGGTTDFDMFLSTLVRSMGDNYHVTQDRAEEQRTSEKWFDTGLKFAHAIIDQNPEFYQF